MHKTYFIFICIFFTFTSQSQTIDSTQIGKEYPYVLPILGKKAYAKGYELQKPFGVMLGTLFNKQGIVIDNFEMAISDDQTPPTNYFALDGILDFGPSEGRINTVNARLDTWILPFFFSGWILWRSLGRTRHYIQCGR